MNKNCKFINKIKLFCILTCVVIFGINSLVYASNTQSSRPAAPYTQQASYKLVQLIKEYGIPKIPVKKQITQSEFLEINIKNMISIWSMAGYDFRKSMNKYIHDMNINPVALGMPPTYNYTMPEIFGYTVISNYYKSKQDEIILRKYFSQETINFFNKNLANNQYKVIDGSKYSVDETNNLKQYQTSSFDNNSKPADRNDIHRFYDGFEYTPVIPTASTVKNNIIQNGINMFSNYLLGF